MDTDGWTWNKTPDILHMVNFQGTQMEALRVKASEQDKERRQPAKFPQQGFSDTGPTKAGASLMTPVLGWAITMKMHNDAPF